MRNVALAAALLPLVGVTLGCTKTVDLGELPRLQITYDADPAPPAEPRPEPPPPPPPKGVSELPDPPAARSAEQVDLVLSFRGGELGLSSFDRLKLDQPVLSARRIGRFAVELYRGQDLVERVRFDFPLLAADAEDPSLEKGLSTSARVRVPALERPNRLVIVDRKTERSLELPWPLEAANAAAPENAAGEEKAEPRPKAADAEKPADATEAAGRAPPVAPESSGASAP